MLISAELEKLASNVIMTVAKMGKPVKSEKFYDTSL